MADFFTEQQLNTLRREYAGIKRVGTHHLPRFHALLDGCPSDEALKQLALAKINFVSKLAINACARRGIALH